MGSIIRFPAKILDAPALPILVTFVALVVGVPLFLRMPPWCDFTLYDVMARSALNGGTLYESVFDTNLPGFVWCLMGLRRINGSVEFVRAVDLTIVALITAVLVRFVPRGKAWLAAAVALWYPFTTEFTHMQRDIWLTLPMLLAVTLRVRSVGRYEALRVPWEVATETPSLPESSRHSQSLVPPYEAILQGCLWAIAVWFKPHFLLVAAVFWFATRPYQPRGERLRDFARQFLGGSVVALAGIIALIATGTWPHLMDVLFKWNASYILTVWRECGSTIERLYCVFPPWSLLHFVAVPVAVYQIVWNRPHVLKLYAFAVLYLTLLVQSVFLQRNFDYCQAPAHFVMFALLAMTLPRLFALFVLAVPLVAWLQPWGYEPPMAYRYRYAMYSSCFKKLDGWAYRDRQHALRIMPQYCSAIDPVQIGEVADYLRSVGAQPGEVLAWHDAPHAVYLELGHLPPPFRFMHITTVLISDRNFWHSTIELCKAYPRIKYIVTDVYHPIRFRLWMNPWDAGPDKLPTIWTPKLRQCWPYDQPAVFRSGGGTGRFIVHKVVSEPRKYEFQEDVWE